jgi:hypothetical protein
MLSSMAKMRAFDRWREVDCARVREPARLWNLHRFDFRSADAGTVAIGVVRDTHGPKRLGDPVSDLYLATSSLVITADRG